METLSSIKIFEELQPLIDFCQKSGLRNDTGFEYRLKDRLGNLEKWHLHEDFYHVFAVYTDGHASVETWHSYNNEAELIDELNKPTIQEIVDKWNEQAKQINDKYLIKSNSNALE